MVSAEDLIEMRVAEVRRERVDSDNHIVVLEDLRGQHRLPIVIGPQEAWAVVFALEGMQLPRPLIYHVMLRSLDVVGARLVEVRIDRLVEQTYHAVAVYDGPLGVGEVDARPSDALNLALLAGVPIRMKRQVWEAGHAVSGRILDTLDEAFPLRGRRVLPEPTGA